MDLRSIIAAMPVLRRLWAWLPRRLRFPLLGAALLVWLWRRVRGRDSDEDAPRSDEA